MKNLCLFLFILLVSLVAPLTASAARAKLLATLSIPVDHQFNGFALSPNGQRVAYVNAAADTTGNLFLSGIGGKPRVLVDSVVGATSFSPDGALLAYVHLEKGRWFLSLYDVKRHKQLRSISLPVEASPGCVSFSADGRQLACAVYAGAYNPCVIRIYRVLGLILKSKLKADIALPYSMAFSDNGRYFAASGFVGDAGIGGTAVWSLNDSRLKRVLAEYGRVVFAPDQHTLILEGKTLDARNPHGPLQSFAHTGYPLRLIGRVNKNQALFCRVTARRGMTEPLELWSIKSRKRTDTWYGVGAFGFSTGLSSTGKTFAAVCTDNGRWVIKVWRLSSK